MITVTAQAAARIHKIVEEKNPGGGLRLGVVGGGCSGLAYKFKVESKARDSDNVIDLEGVPLIVDPKSMQYLDGMTLDFIDTILEQSFVFKNPKASKSCGCGKSFVV